MKKTLLVMAVLFAGTMFVLKGDFTFVKILVIGAIVVFGLLINEIWKTLQRQLMMVIGSEDKIENLASFKRLTSFKCFVNISLDKDFVMALLEELGLSGLLGKSVISTGLNYGFEYVCDLMSGLSFIIMDGKILTSYPIHVKCLKLDDPSQFSLNESLMEIRSSPNYKIEFFRLKKDDSLPDHYEMEKLGFFPIHRFVDGLKSLYQIILPEIDDFPPPMFDKPRLIRHFFGADLLPYTDQEEKDALEFLRNSVVDGDGLTTWEVEEKIHVDSRGDEKKYIDMYDLLFKSRFGKLSIIFEPISRTILGEYPKNFETAVSKDQIKRARLEK